MLDIDNSDYLLGIVNWFGGYNRKTNKENDYGFIKSMDGRDIFVHKSQLSPDSVLSENELVIFKVSERKGKEFAKSVVGLNSAMSETESLFKIYLKSKDEYSEFFALKEYRQSLIKLIDDNFISGNMAFFAYLNKEGLGNYHIYELIKDSNNWNDIFNLVIHECSFNALIESDLPWNLIPPDYLYEKSNEINTYIDALEDERETIFFKLYLESLPVNVVLECVIKNIITDQKSISDKFAAMAAIVDSYYLVNDAKNINRIVKSARRNLLIYGIIRFSNNWKSIFRLVVDGTKLSELLSRSLSLRCVPPDYLKEKSGEIYKYIEASDEGYRDRFIEIYINDLPDNVILECIINKLLTDAELVSCRLDDIRKLIDNMYREKNDCLPDYTNILLGNNSLVESDYSSIPILRPILEPILFKKYLYLKKHNFKQYFDNSVFLGDKIEYFILANLFSLIQVSNTLDVTYAVFLHRLWEALVAEDIDIKDKGLLTLFPSCSTMGKHDLDLSCEAVYWPKTELHLCRGRVCTNPQVIPNCKKHYLDFNIYDWFRHYGINYINEDVPSKKDFPIKLAGYFNRLKELLAVLHCRECNNLMKPDMKYARVEYIDYESGEPVKKSMAAAYRATVFECGAINCKEYQKKYYISHCIGFGCNSIIDTRDLKIKCDNGLYICRGCGSCCEKHAKDNPVGFCPECGSKLDLYEDAEKIDRYGKETRYVRCSNKGCDFEITSNLPKKFYLPSCMPVKKIGGAQNDYDAYADYCNSKHNDSDDI